MNAIRSILPAVAVLLAPAGSPAAAQAPADDSYGAPLGMIAYYTAASEKDGQISCPSGWTAYQAALGYMILATTDSSQFGVTRGTALSGDLAQPMHSHPMTVKYTIDGHKSWGGSGSSQPYAQSGSYSPTGTSGAGPTGYGFVQYVICQATASIQHDTMPANAVAYFDKAATSGACPSGWGLLNSASGYFIMAGSQNMQIGTPIAGASQNQNGTSNTWWNVNYAFPTHQHASYLTQTYTPPMKNMTKAAMGGGLKAMDNAIEFYATLGSNTGEVVPAIALMTCQKSTGAAAATAGGAAPATPGGAANDFTGIPDSISFYFSSTKGCPPGSATELGAAGSFILGIPNGSNPSLGGYTQGGHVGTPLDDPGSSVPWHVNPVSLPIELGSLTSGHGGGSKTHYAEGGAYTVTGISGPAQIQIPLYPLLLCSKGR